MAFEFKVTRRVEFSETDMAGIVHYSNFFKYMETAEHAFWRSLGLSVVMDRHDPPVGWPRVRAECDFLAPAVFEDEIEIHLLVCEKRTKSLSYLFCLRKLNVQPPLEVARGKLTVVCVTRDEAGRLVSLPIPKAIADQVEVAPAELLARVGQPLSR